MEEQPVEGGIHRGQRATKQPIEDSGHRRIVGDKPDIQHREERATKEPVGDCKASGQPGWRVVTPNSEVASRMANGRK